MAETSEQDMVIPALSIMRRMPPKDIEKNLTGLLNLLPESTEELLQRIDQPLSELMDPETGRPFLLCDYNRDGDSYRSPWSNKYFPEVLEDGFVPSDHIRNIEIEANELFDAYREMYYEGGTSSVYLWDLDHGFAGCFLIRKAVTAARFVRDGSWNSIHIVEVIEEKNGAATYKLTTTIMMSMEVERELVGDTNLSGSLTRQTQKTTKLNDSQHLSNIGSMIEDMENNLRKDMDALYIQKTETIINSIRTSQFSQFQTRAHIDDLNVAVKKHGDERKIDSEV